MGGRPVMAATGHSLIKAKLAETGAPLAGEMSGHIFFADGYYGFDDAVYVAVRLLGILSRSAREPRRDARPAAGRRQYARNCAFACDGEPQVRGRATRSANACARPEPR